MDCIAHKRDRYHGLLAVSYAGDKSTNDRLVSEGWALECRKYSSDYLEAEAGAKTPGAGVWRGEFMDGENRAMCTTAGRFGWWLAGVVRLPIAVPARGLQGMWPTRPEVMNILEQAISTFPGQDLS